MKLINLIRPHFGAISICNAFVGDSRNEEALDRYDKDCMTQMDANYHLYANLNLEDQGFEQGIVRFEFDNGDETISRIFLDVCFKDAESIEKSHIQAFVDYLEQSDLFDDYTPFKGDPIFRNGINEIHIELYEDEVTIELYAPSASGLQPLDNYEKGVFRTVSSLYRGEQDEWPDYLKEATTKKVKLMYSRDDAEYPCLWLVLTEEDFKNNPSKYTMHLTVGILREIMVQAGWEKEAESWVDRSLERYVLDPVTWEPMDLVQILFKEGAKPMTSEQLDKAFEDIDYWDNERTAPPGVWDETPIG